MDIIRFYGEYGILKAFNKEFRDINKRDAIAVLSNVLKACEDAGYVYSGIDTGVINSAVRDVVNDKGPHGFIKALKLIKMNKLINEAIPKKELRPVAKSYIFNRLLFYTGVKYYPDLDLPSDGNYFKKDGELGFVVSLNDWTMIKRTKLAGAKEYEISAFASRVFSTTIDHLYQFMGKDVNFERVKGLKLENEIFNVKEPYDAYSIFKRYGVLPYPHIEMLIKAYPDLKIRKGRGRLPKG